MKLRIKLESQIAALSTVALGVAFGVSGACGGSTKAASEEPTPAASSEGDGESGGDGTVVSAETMDEIRRALDRKRNVVARCLSPAVDAGELPKNARGRMTLGFVITSSGGVGKADDLKVVKSSLESKLLTDCVFARLGEIEFPAVAEPVPWSYTYGFETM
jgi:hypothetical protein